MATPPIFVPPPGTLPSHDLSDPLPFPTEPEWQGIGVPIAPPPALAVPDIGFAATPELLPAPTGLPVAPDEVVPSAPSIGTSTAPPPAAAPVAAPPPMPAPSVDEVRQRVTPGPDVPAEQRAPVAAGQQAEFLAETAAAQAGREADYLAGFAERVRQINERDRLAREQVTSNLARIDERMAGDQEEIRTLTRDTSMSSGAKAGMIIGAGLQALKALIGAGKADTNFVDEVIQRDAAAKAQALQLARERAGITEDQRATELGRFQELDYLKQTAVATTWEDIAAGLRADAATAQSNEAKLQLVTAAERAEAAALNARQMAQDAAVKQEIETATSLAKLAEIRAKTRQTEADAARSERRAMGGGPRRKDGSEPTGLTVEKQLSGLTKGERLEVEELGIRGPTGEFLTRPDGTFIKARSKERADKLSEQWAGVRTVNNLLMRIEGLRAEYGHEWDISNSRALQDMQSTMRDLQLKLKETYKLGAITGSDLELLEQITGGDPSGWFDKSPTWAAMRSRMEDAWSSEINAHTGYQGRIRLPRFDRGRRSLEQISQPLDQPYNPVRGTIIDANTRLAALDEERMRITTAQGEQSQREAAERLGMPLAKGPAGLRLATEVAIERVERRVHEQHDELIKRMMADREAARREGDTARAERITASIAEERRFRDAARSWAAEQRKKLDDTAQAEAQRAETAERGTELQRQSEKLTPRTPGGRTF